MVSVVDGAPPEPVYRGEVQECEEMELFDHGGTCCGLRHVSGMGLDPLHPDVVYENDYGDPVVSDSTTKLTALQQILSQLRKAYSGICAEVVLAEYQQRAWHDTLLKEGFKKTFSFCNSNSGNYCYVYLWSNSEGEPK